MDLSRARGQCAPAAPPAPVPGSQVPPPKEPSWECPEGNLGKGDLVIISGASPSAEGKKEGEGGATIADFENAAGPLGFTLSKINPTTVDSLAEAIKQGVIANRGKKFQRIIILSHAGGPTDSPSIELSETDKLKPDKINNGLIAEVTGALNRNGIVILASCGYFYEDMDGNRGYRTAERTQCSRTTINCIRINGLTIFSATPLPFGMPSSRTPPGPGRL